jgi:hypothetical protein
MKKTTTTLTTVLAVKAISSLMGTSEIGEQNKDILNVAECYGT